MKKITLLAALGLYHLVSVGMCPIESGSAVTTENTPVTITLKADETATGMFSIVSPPTNGVLGPVMPIDDVSATVEYTPNEDFTGVDSFEFAFDMVCTATIKIAVLSGEVNTDLSFAIMAKYMQFCDLLPIPIDPMEPIT